MAVPASQSQHWETLAIRGVVAILFGLAVLLWPRITLGVLITLLGALALITGLLFIVAAVRTAGRHGQFWLQAAEGGLGIVIGLFVLFWPSTSAAILLYVIAFWAIITGIPEIIAAVGTKDWLSAGGGAALVVFGLILILSPGANALSVTWLIAIVAFVYGGLTLARALRLLETAH